MSDSEIKPWVKSYAGGKPNYTTPFECPRCGHCCRVDWVGLTEDEVMNIWYQNGFECMIYAKAIEAKLKEKNVPQS